MDSRIMDGWMDILIDLCRDMKTDAWSGSSVKSGQT